MNYSQLISLFSRYIHRITDQDVSQLCGLSNGTTATKMKTANTIYYNVYNLSGIEYAATDNIIVTACTQQSSPSFCYYLVSINAAGKITTTKGVDNTYALPSLPSGSVAIGAFLINTDPYTAFIAGTTSFTATGITSNFYDIDTGIAGTLINQAQRRLERGVTIINNNRQILIMDFDHMLVRCNITIAEGDDTVTLPFANYKDFQDDGLSIIDTNGTVCPIEKRDTMPMGTPFEERPRIISRMPPVEIVFTKDGFPAREFDIWPVSDNTYTLDLIAYQFSPDLDGVVYPNNWLTDNAPDILLFGALVEAASFFPNDERIPEWKLRWNEAVWTLYSAQNKEKYSGRMVGTNFPNPLGRKESLGLSSNKSGIYSFGFSN